MNTATKLFRTTAPAASKPDYVPSMRAERLVAIGRVALASASLAAVWLDPSAPSRYPGIAYALMSVYSVYALVLAISVWRRPARSASRRLLTHVTDLAVFTAVIYLTEGATSPFFLYFIFSLLSATLRFQLRGTFWTAIASLLIFIGMGMWASLVLNDPDFELNRFLIRSVYLSIAGVLLIYLSVHQEQHRHELWRLSNWPRLIDEDLPALLSGLLRHAAVTLRTDKAVVLLRIEGEESGRLISIDGERSTSEPWTGSVVAPHLEDVDFYCRGLDSAPLVMTTADEAPLTSIQPLDPAIQERLEPSGAVSVRLSGARVSGRLLVLDTAELTSDDMVLCRIVAETIVARLDEYFLLEEIRTSAIASERVRVSRELHDGLLQSLTGIALQLRVAERVLSAEPDRAITILAQVRDLIVRNQRDLRDFVQSLRDQEVSSGDPPLSLKLMAIGERARMEWSMKVSLDLDGEAMIPTDVARQLTPLINEAISNAGRHGGADLVQVHLASQDDALTLRIKDNGRGFPFHGRYSLDDLNTQNIGPLTLRERVAELRGQLQLESTDSGAVLDIRIPFGESMGTGGGR